MEQIYHKFIVPIYLFECLIVKELESYGMNIIFVIQCLDTKKIGIFVVL